MGMKPRIRSKPKEPEVSEQPREPIPVAALGGSPAEWAFIHETLHDLEDTWGNLTPFGRDAFMKSLAVFLGGACALTEEKHAALASTQATVRQGFVNYREQRNNVCQAVTAAHVFEHGDQKVN